MIAADGRTVWIRDIVSVVVEAGRPTRLHGVMVDISRQKQVELERDRLLREAQEALRQRDEFLAVAAHELRTPINVLWLQMQSLNRSLERGELVVSNGQRQKFERASAQAERLAQLVATVLDVSRLMDKELELSRGEFDLREAVYEVVSALDGAITTAKATLEVRADRPVIGCWDRLRIEQLVMNLLTNAMKYGNGNPVEVIVSEEGGTALLEVRDHGIGIANDALARIFLPFERAVSMRSYGGLGLGLYIAERIAAAHGGSIEVKSELGVGSTFLVKLPVRAPE
jgi:signal transduction histidine kinase